MIPNGSCPIWKSLGKHAEVIDYGISISHKTGDFERRTPVAQCLPVEENRHVFAKMFDDRRQILLGLDFEVRVEIVALTHLRCIP